MVVVQDVGVHRLARLEDGGKVVEQRHDHNIVEPVSRGVIGAQREGSVH